MSARLLIAVVPCLTVCALATAAEPGGWWNPRWRLRTAVTRPTPYRDAAARPVEVAVDFPLLLKQAGVAGAFDPASVRVVDGGREIPCVLRTEHDPEAGRERAVVAWLAQPKLGEVGTAHIYFDTKDRGIKAKGYEPKLLPPENLLANPGFEQQGVAWSLSPAQLVRFGTFAHTTGKQSLQIAVDEKTPKDARREMTVSQKVDVRRWAGQEMVFECDLLAERAAYGCPVAVELEQRRADGSRIAEYAVQSRWLTLELAEGHFVQFRQRGRFSPEAATLNAVIRLRCSVRDADTNAVVAGPESFFTVWLDRVVVRPCERWPWPAETHAGFVEGALAKAPLNRAFEFTGQRRLAFTGASEGTLHTGRFNPNPRSVHWGLVAGTLEFWCKPRWDAADGKERILFDAVAYMHRRQCRLVKRDAGGKNQLEFTIADAGCDRHSVRGPAPLRAGRWHHIAATWDFAKAHLQLFVDGTRVAQHGPGGKPWLSSLVADDKKRKKKGIGIVGEDCRSLPMQAFIGGDKTNHKERAAEAAIDEFRVSDVARYAADFEPPRQEFTPDDHTRVLFHLEGERHGVHSSDDRFVRGHLACELPRHEDKAPLDILKGGKVEHRMVLANPHASVELFEKSRVDNRLTVYRPHRPLPDPRYVELRERQVERVVDGTDDAFAIEVGGDHEPWTRSVTWAHAEGAPPTATPLPRWRANDAVVPFSVEEIAATLAPDAKSDIEKAFEVWRYCLQTTNYFDAHYCETLPNGRHRSRISYTLLKHLNIYPFEQCGPLNYTARKLFLAAGISSNDASGTHHQFEQAFYAGGWRLHDLSARQYWLKRDNASVVGRDGLEDDPYLKLRQGGNINAWIRGRRSRHRYGGAVRPHKMDFPLRPGETASVCWHNEGRWFELTRARQPIPLAKIPPSFGNGAIVYQPTDQGDAAALDNLAVTTSRGKPPALQPREPGKPASLVYRLLCPYILSDARVAAAYSGTEPGAIRLAVSVDQGKTWTQVWRSPDKQGIADVNLRDHVTARYAYWLKLELTPDASEMRGLTVRTTFVAAPLSLPGTLRRGSNRITFVGPKPAVPVATACRWVERHTSDLGVALNALSFYLDGDGTHRNVFVAPPGQSVPIAVALLGKEPHGDVSVEGLPRGWAAGERMPAPAKLTVAAKEARAGDIHGFDVVVRQGQHTRRVPAQLLVADAPLVREAEAADQAKGAAKPVELPEASGARVMEFTGDGGLTFDLAAPAKGPYALWLRARWAEGSSTSMRLILDDGKPRRLRAMAMIGFTDWTDPRKAHTKMFAHFGEQYTHWSWYRVPDVELTKGKHRLTLAAGAGASFDAFLLLPQTPTVDRAAMNLLMNWNYAPWQNPL